MERWAGRIQSVTSWMVNPHSPSEMGNTSARKNCWSISEGASNSEALPS